MILDAVVDTVLNDYLLAGQREQRNVLTNTVSDAATALSLTYDVKGATEGAKLSLDFEDMHVVSSDAGAKTATVIRGQYGTVPAEHDAGTTVWVNPKWSRAQVLRAVNQGLDSLSGKGLFQMATLDLTFVAPRQGYDLTGLTADDVIDVYEVRSDDPGPGQGWRPIQNWQLIRDASSSDFPSGLGLVLFDGGFPGHTLRVTYRRRFSQLGPDGTVDVSDTGLDREAHDLVALEAAISLVLGKEVQRNQLSAQPDTRRAEDVPPGAALQSVNGLVKRRDERLREEKARLARRYPVRKQAVA